MSIKNFKIQFPGQVGIVPRIGHLHSTDTLATVTSSGYLNKFIKSQGFSVLPTDVILVRASDGTQFYKPVFSGETITLTALP